MARILDGYLTDRELAAELGVKIPTLREWRSRGYGPSFTRLGHKLLYRHAAVQEWLASRERRPA